MKDRIGEAAEAGSDGFCFEPVTYCIRSDFLGGALALAVAAFFAGAAFGASAAFFEGRVFLPCFTVQHLRDKLGKCYDIADFSLIARTVPGQHSARSQVDEFPHSSRTRF